MKIKYPFLLIIFVFMSCTKKDSDSEPKVASNKKSKEYSHTGKPNTIREYDKNKNKITDLRVIYDDRGWIQKIERDANENGVFEGNIYYNNGERVKEILDQNEDGLEDAVRFYKGDIAVKTIRDRDFDGKWDFWQDRDKYDRWVTKIDSNRDGQPDIGGDSIVEGDKLLGQKQYDEAFAAYKETLNFSSTCALAYWGMAKALEGMKKYKLAIKHYERYILLKGPHKSQALRRMNYLKNMLKKSFRTLE